MPQSLAPIPQGLPITDEQGAATLFFLLRWQDLITSFTQTPTVAKVNASGLTAALATTAIRTLTVAGDYEVGYYIQKTTADGVSSSLTVTLSWTSNGIAQTRAFAALTTDTTGANQSAVIPIYADASTDVTIAVAYASNTPNTMAWLYRATLKLCV